MAMEFAPDVLRRARPIERTLRATLGEGEKLYALASAAYKEGRASGDETRLRWAAQILRQCVRRGERDVRRR